LIRVATTIGKLQHLEYLKPPFLDTCEWAIRPVFPDTVTFIKEALDKISPFMKLCILPELVGKWFTRPAELSHDHVVSVDPINVEASVEPLEGPSEMTVDATEDDTVSVIVTVTSDILTSTRDSQQPKILIKI